MSITYVSEGDTLTPTNINAWLNEASGGVHNVKAYGATGDGTTDDTVAIQAALTAAATTPGGTVYLPKGTYIVTSTLTVPDAASAFHILGDGAGRSHSGGVNGNPTTVFGTEIRYQGLTGYAIEFAPTTIDKRQYVTLEHFNLLGNKDVVGASAGGGIRFYGAASGVCAVIPTMRSIHVMDAYDHGIFFDGLAIEGYMSDVRTVGNGGDGLRCSAQGAADAPGELTCVSMTANLNGSAGVRLGGGGQFWFYGLTATQNVGSGFVTDNAIVGIFGLNTELNGSPFIHIKDCDGFELNKVSINYGSADPDTGVLFEGSSYGSLRGLVTNSQSGQTDFNIDSACNRVTVENYVTGDYVDRFTDAGLWSVVRRGTEHLRGYNVKVVSPTALASGSSDDYDPGTNTTLRLTPNASNSTLTGMAGGKIVIGDGRRVRLINVGSSGSLILADEDANSAAYNRFMTSTGAALTLTSDQAADAEYDATSQRWRVWKLT